jgi:chorismate synthase
MNTIGTQLRLTVFGESHGKTIGAVLDGIASGIALDLELIRFELWKRRPKSTLSTPRVETDEFEFVAGLQDGVTTGAAIAFLVHNANFRSEDYDKTAFIPRPGHADYPAFVKYLGHHDKRGGGIFSGRITVLLTIAGAIAKQILNAKGIFVGSRIASIHGVKDVPLDPLTIGAADLKRWDAMDFPVEDERLGEAMKQEIETARKEQNSVGGIVETFACGIPAGIGEPLYHSVESALSELLFSIPAVKGVAFGDGFDFAERTGLEASDGYRLSDGHIETTANHNGGILGGITTGMPLRIRTVFKPTSSIGLPQPSVRLDVPEDTILEIHGRHDPAIIHRAIHVVNAAVCFGLLDLILEEQAKAWMRP